jgi:outer membrane murein-binding lipoprotein Lpp
MIGKGTLFVVAAVALAGMLLSYGINTNVVESEARIAEDEFEILARNAALAGLSQGEQELADEISATSGSFTERTLTGTYESGTYTTAVEQMAPKQVRIRSTGNTLTARGDTMGFDVQAYYRVVQVAGSGGDDDIPEAMQEAITSRCDVEMGGSVVVQGADGSNANVRTDGAIDAGTNNDGKGVFGRGYVGSLSGFNNDNQRDQFYNYFKPQDELSGESVSEVDPLPEDAWDEIDDLMNELRNRADYVVYPEDEDGVQDHDGPGTAVTSIAPALSETPSELDPLIINVKGDLTLNSNTTIPAYTIFVVDGGAHINGSVMAGTPPQDADPYQSTVAFYIAGDTEFRLNGNAEVWGQFFVGADIDLSHINGNATVNGNITSLCSGEGSTSKMNGNFTLNYYGANPALSGAEPQWTLERQTHSEW